MSQKSIRDNGGIQDVIALLKEQGLSEWVVPCALLYEQTQGIEEVMEEDCEFPEHNIREVVQQAVQDRNPRDRLGEGLSQLTTFFYRVVALSTKEKWNPLQESYNRFVQRHRMNVTIYRDFTQYPSVSDVAAWLREQTSAGKANNGFGDTETR